MIEMPNRSARTPTPAHAGRFVIVFALAALLQFGILLAPWTRPAVDGFSWALVHMSASMIKFLGGHALAQNMIMSAPSGFAIEMKDGCNGVNVMILLWSAVLAFPASRSAKQSSLPKVACGLFF